jgi:hypothetical protein
MSKENEQEIARLSRLNAELSESLQRCRDLVEHWRSHVAANNNEPNAPDTDEDKRLG